MVFENIRVLYVEDDLNIAEEVIRFLKKRVKVLHVAHNGIEGLALYKQYHPDLIITDIQMPKMNGLQMCSKIREDDCNTPILVTSAHNDNTFLTRAIELRVSGYIIKPVDLKSLLETMQKVLEPILLKRELEAKNKELAAINTHLDAMVLQKTQELEYMYHHDTLTGLCNIIKLKEVLYSGRHDFLLLLDISEFAMINKEFGKEFGDHVLAQTAKVLKLYIENDIELFKIESDRFVFLLKNCDKAYVVNFCSTFQTIDILVDDHPLSVSFHVGIDSMHNKKFSLVNAEYALDVSKNSVHQDVYFYDAESEYVKEAKEMMQWLNITKEMIDQGLIEPYYQPIFNVKKNSVNKYEVLARGLYNGEIIAPVNFLIAAERLGLMTMLTRMIISKSFAYFANTQVEFSINITEHDLMEDYLETFISQKLQEHHLKSSQVTLEVLESVTTTVMHENVIQKLRCLSDMGLKISVDDFGVENSNLSRLIDMDFDSIKLDGVFIKNLHKNEKDRVIVRAIVSLARTLGIKVVAEFVENKEIFDIVKSCGIDYIQGYFIGKPEASAQHNLHVD